MDIESEPSPHKRFRVIRNARGLAADTLASFDTLQEATVYVATLRHDWSYVIRDHGRKIVWPEKRS